MNITSQNRHGQECCSQGENSWRDRKSPGKASNERSQAALISDISDPVVWAELKEKSSDKINDKAMGNTLYKNLWNRAIHDIRDPGKVRYQKRDKQLGKQKGVSSDNEKLKESDVYLRQKICKEFL